jgi:hypothetical protein
LCERRAEKQASAKVLAIIYQFQTLLVNRVTGVCIVLSELNAKNMRERCCSFNASFSFTSTAAAAAFTIKMMIPNHSMKLSSASSNVREWSKNKLMQKINKIEAFLQNTLSSRNRTTKSWFRFIFSINILKTVLQNALH